ncbi:MAG TPA: MDR family MFS transporter [Pseudonocardia sp.]|jgi:EmrB/QacA subfamily drug resistance transporter|nr:MDR family MFS transporter [Pseudonocardia sp.]
MVQTAIKERRSAPEALRPAAPPPAPPAPAGPSTANLAGPPAASGNWLVPVIVLVVGNFMAVLDVTIVNVAVPAIQKEFGGSLDDTLWIATAYTLMLGVVVPLSGWLGDRFGLKNVYVASLIGFAIGSALCGLAWNLDVLVVFRVLQAIPGGIMPVVAMTMVFKTVPMNKIGAAMGVFGVGIVFAPAVGPVLGGYLVQYVDWRLVFYVNVPAGLLGALAAFVILPAVPKLVAKRFDLPGFLCIGLGLFALLLAVSEGQDWGWTSFPVLMLAAVGVNLMALFVLIELAVKNPLLDIRVFRVLPFTNSILLLGILQINLLAIAFYAPVFLQQGQHKEAFDAGLLLLPGAVATGVLMPMVGRLYDKIGPKLLATSGMLICGFGTYLMCNITADMTRGDLIFWTCVRGVGLGLSIMPINTAGLASLPPAQTNQGSALINVARQVSGALGLAFFAALASMQQAQLFANRTALIPQSTTPVTSTGEPTLAQVGPLFGRLQQLNAEIQATSYSNIFLITAVLTASGMFLVLALRAPGKRAPGAVPVE